MQWSGLEETVSESMKPMGKKGWLGRGMRMDDIPCTDISMVNVVIVLKQNDSMQQEQLETIVEAGREGENMHKLTCNV